MFTFAILFIFMISNQKELATTGVAYDTFATTTYAIADSEPIGYTNKWLL